MKEYNFRKEWPKIKRQLVKVSQDALTLAKKGEKEIVRLSQVGKVHVDATALNLKLEHLYHLIGKEYVTAECPPAPTPKLKGWVEECLKIDKDIKELKKRLQPKTEN